jgi:hypothetical protein
MRNLPFVEVGGNMIESINHVLVLNHSTAVVARREKENYLDGSILKVARDPLVIVDVPRYLVPGKAKFDDAREPRKAHAPRKAKVAALMEDVSIGGCVFRGRVPEHG